MLLLLVPGVGMGGSSGDAVDVGAGLPARRRYILPNNMRVECTEQELDSLLLPFTTIERQVVKANAVVARPIKKSTVAIQAAIEPTPIELEIQQDIALLLLL